MVAKKGSYKERETDCPPNIERQNPMSGRDWYEGVFYCSVSS